MTGAFSFFINILVLVSPIYMMQVYNRVLPTRNEPTLLVLTGLACGLLLVMAMLEVVRSRLLIRVSGRIDLKLNNRVLTAIFASALCTAKATTAQGLRDLDTLRQFVGGQGMFAFFDLPWTPLLIGVVFLLHPLLGVIATIGAVLLFSIAVLNELVTHKPLAEANRHSIGVIGFVGSSLRNAEVLAAMGMFNNLQSRWAGSRNDMLRLQTIASDRASIISAAGKALRLLLQVALLGTGAYLAIHDAVTPGAIIASSIVVGRALSPFEMAIGSWKQFVSARAAYAALKALLVYEPDGEKHTSLPRPLGALSIENLFAIPPGGTLPTLRQVNFKVEPGQVVAVVGPSGAGKSTLARMIVGAWPPYAGKVRIDGADIHTWNKDELGPCIGYLPQDVELFDGTVSENIARFGEIDSEAVVAAARLAGVHEMILRLPRGYDTPIGPGGSSLSGGQRQRIGLARALYGNPVLVVLDEPSSNLDEEGEAALVKAVIDIKQTGATVILVSHRPNIMAAIDQILVLTNGVIRMYGARDEVLGRLARPAQSAEPEQRPALRA